MDTIYRKSWTITIKKKDIFFDMDLLSLGYSEVAGGEGVRRRDRIALDTSAGNGRRIVTRLCDHKVSDIKQLFQRFLDDGTSDTADNTLKDDDYTINLLMPIDADEADLPAITDLCHDYIVNAALADYYAQVGTSGNRESLQMRAADDLAKLRELIFHRPMP